MTLPLDEYEETELNEAFKWAAKKGHLEVVERLLQDERADPDHGIYWAAKNDHLAVVERLLQDVRVNPAANNNYIIRWAASNGHLDVIERLLLDKRVNPAADNNLAIRWAAARGYLAVVQRLLQDERVDPSDNNNQAICWATYNWHWPVALRLLKCPGQLTYLQNELPDTWEDLNQLNLKALSAQLPSLQTLPFDLINFIMKLCNPITRAYPEIEEGYSSIINPKYIFANSHQFIQTQNMVIEETKNLKRPRDENDGENDELEFQKNKRMKL